MKLVSYVVMCFVLCAAALGQASHNPRGAEQARQIFPHPYVGVGIDLFASGYTAAGWQGSVGLMFDSKHFIFDSIAGYDNGRKADDGSAKLDPKGHDRLLRGFASYKFGNAYVGVGGRWGMLSTTNYTKGGSPSVLSSWRPEVGVGYDVFADDEWVPLFARLQAAYMFRQSKELVTFPDGSQCTTCGNHSQGADISIWFPSPARKNQHVFFKINALIFQFKDYPTSPNHRYTDTTEFMLLYRF